MHRSRMRSSLVITSTSIALAAVTPGARAAAPSDTAGPGDEAIVSAPASSFDGGRVDLVCPKAGVPFDDIWVLVPDGDGAPTDLSDVADLLASRGAMTFTLDLRGLDEAHRADALSALLGAIRRFEWQTSTGACAAPLREQVACEHPGTPTPDCHVGNSERAPLVRGVVAYGDGAATFVGAAFRPGCEAGRASDGARQRMSVLFVSPDFTRAPDVDGDACRDVFARVWFVEPGAPACSPGAEDAPRRWFDDVNVEIVSVPKATRCDVATPGSTGCEAACGPATDPSARSTMRRWIAAFAGNGSTEDLATVEKEDVASGRAVRSSRVASRDGGVGFNLSLVVGGGGARDAAKSAFGFAFDVRPELLLHRRRVESWGYGPYAEIGSMGSGGLLFGGGGTLSIPIVRSFDVAPSLGLHFARPTDGTFAPGWTAGAFVGHRMFNPISGFDATFGVRFDYRRAFEGDVAAWSIGLQLDATILVAGAAWL